MKAKLVVFDWKDHPGMVVGQLQNALSKIGVKLQVHNSLDDQYWVTVSTERVSKAEFEKLRQRLCR